MSNILDVKQNKCLGCKACYMSCPVNAIDFKRDHEGFEYPVLDTKKCINCGICLKNCPTMTNNTDNIGLKTFAVRCKDEDKLMRSSSGGAFGVMAEYVINNSGVVYGVIFNNTWGVEYSRATSFIEVEKMRGSKYVEAYLSSHVIDEFIRDVISEKNILFSGTSCQIAGMKSICKLKKIDDRRVIYVDFYKCSGRVSSLLWKSECDEDVKKGEIQNISFRNKKNGWKTFCIYKQIDNKDYYVDFLTHRWSKFLGKTDCKRISCAECSYSSGRSGADISIGDFWAKIKLPKCWKDNRGLSILKVNTNKGMELFEKIISEIEYEEVVLDNYDIDKNPKQVDMDKRKEFWKMYNEQGYQKICEKYAKVTLKDKILFGIVRFFLIKLNII